MHKEGNYKVNNNGNIQRVLCSKQKKIDIAADNIGYRYGCQRYAAQAQFF